MQLLLLLCDICSRKKYHVRLDVACRFLRGQLIGGFLRVNGHIHPLEDESHQVVDLLNGFIYRMLLYMLQGMVFLVEDFYFTRIFSI